MSLQGSMKRAALFAALGIASAAQAQVVNGGFEADAGNSLSITGWSKVGHDYVATTANYEDPTHGTKEAIAATTLDGTYTEPAGNGVDGPAAETALGLTGGSLQGVGNGNVADVSAIYQTIHFNAGDKIVFDAALLTNQAYNTGDDFSVRPDATNNDFGFLSLSSGGSSSVTKLINMFDGYDDYDPSSAAGFHTSFHYDPDVNDPFLGESLYKTYTFTVAVAGDYKVGLGATNAYTGNNPDGLNTGLLVDDVHIVAAPEPTSMAALALGLLALGRRRKKA